MESIIRKAVRTFSLLVALCATSSSWAATPVATWTDFRNLTSGGYTWTVGGNSSVDQDTGVLTIGSTGGVYMDISSIGSNNRTFSLAIEAEIPGTYSSDKTIVDLVVNGSHVSVAANGTTIGQCWTTGGIGSYGSGQFTAGRQLLTFTFQGASGQGSHTYINGTKIAEATGLMSSSGNVTHIGIGSFDKTTEVAEGLKIYSVRLYTSKLSATDVSTDYSTYGVADYVATVTSDTTLESLTWKAKDGTTQSTMPESYTKLDIRGTGTVTSSGQYTKKMSFVNGIVFNPASISSAAAFFGTGTLYLKNTTIVGFYASNLADEGGALRLTGVTGYIQANNTCKGTLDLRDDGSTKALTLNNGWSSYNPTVFAKLAGDGTLTASNSDVSQRFVFKDISSFTGSIDMSGKKFRVIMGDGASLDPAEGTITIVSGTTARIAENKTWSAKGGIVVNGSLIVESGAGAPAVVGGTGTVKALGDASLDIGTARPTIAGIGAAGTLAVSVTPTISERIVGYTPTVALAVTGGIAGTVTLNGVAVDPVTDGSTATLTGTAVAGNPTYTGNGWWWDYEFNGNGNNIGSEGTGLSWDGDRAFKNSEYTTADGSGNQMLHLPARPWRDVTAYPSEFTAVMYCKAGATANGILVAFGSTTWGTCKTITLSTGANPSAGEMRLVYGSGKTSSTDLVEGGFTLDNITSANHLYAFTVKTVDNKSQIAVYADGDLLTTYTADSVISLGSGFQIASGHGGLPSGLSRLANDDAATMDFLRVSNVALSEDAIKALAAEYRYVSPNGIAERTLSENATWTDATSNSWSQKTLNEDGSNTTTAQAAPNSGTVVEITASTDVQLTMDLESEVSYEKLTFQGDGAITVKAGGTAPTVTTRTYINTDVTMDIGAFASLGATTIAAGKTLTVVPNEQSTLSTAIGLGIRGTASSIVTGTVTLGADSQVVLPDSMVSAFAAYGFTLALERDASGRYVYTISRDDNPVYITKAASTGAITYAMYPKDCPLFSLPGEPEIIPSDFAYTVTIENMHASDPITVATAFAGGNVKIIDPNLNGVTFTGNFTGEAIEFDIPSGDTLNLTGTVAVDEIVFKGGGTVVCSAGNTLQGVVKGSATIQYPTGVLPVTETDGVNVGVDFTDTAWKGTVILTNCQFFTGETRQRAPFEMYGSVNSIIKAPGFKGYAANTAQDTICQAELIIDEGTTFEFNHGWKPGDTDVYSEGQNANFKFRKLSGAGTLRLDGTTDYAQYIFCDVSDFTGDVEITFPGEGGRKSYLFGAPADYNTVGSAYPANLVIMGSVTNAAGRTWTIPAGVIVSEGATLTLGDGSITTAIMPSTRGTISVPSGTAYIAGVTNSTIGAVLDIAAGATLCISNTAMTKLTIPAETGVTYKNSGTLDLSKCTALEELYLELGDSKTFDFTKVSLPASCTTVYYYVGESRDMNAYTGTFSGTIHYIATETINEFRDGLFTMTNVPEGARVWVIRKTGAVIEAEDTTGGANTRSYNKGSVFSGGACVREWDFELKDNRLKDTGKDIDTSSAVALTADGATYTTFKLANNENKWGIDISSSVRPSYSTEAAFSDNWSAAIRCTMPSDAGKHVAVAFGDTDNGILGLAYDNTVDIDIVELFKWNSGTYTPLANLQVERAEEAMHIYVIAVTNDTSVVPAKKYLSFYRDGEFIHKVELDSPTTINGFMAGGVIEGTTARTGLPDDASSGCVDYVRLYDKTLDAVIAEGLSERRPFISQYETYVRTVSGNADWSFANSWASKTNDAVTVAAPEANTHVTLLANGLSAMSINLDAYAQYNTLIIDSADGAPDNTWIEIGSNGAGRIGAEMIVVRTKVTVEYGAVKFADAMVGVDAGAELTFNFAKFPFEQLTEPTNIWVTGKVVARKYDTSIDARIKAAGEPPVTWVIDNPAYDSTSECYYVRIRRDHEPGTDVYYKEGYWSSTEDSFSVTNAAGKTTTVFEGDTVVVPAYLSGARTNDAYIGSPLPTNVKTIKVNKNYKFMPGVSTLILGGAEITVASGSTLTFADTQWNQLKLGAVTLNGAVRFIDDVEATSIAGNAAITVDSGKTLTLDAPSAADVFTGSFSGSGTVKIASVTGAFNAKNYIIGAGTLALGGMDGYFVNTGSEAVNISSSMRLDGNVMITALSDWTYTFAKITGEGDFTIPASNSSKAFTIQNIEDYTGSLNAARAVTVDKISVASEPAGGALLLATNGTGTVTVSAVHVNGVPASWPVAYAEGGVYKPSASYNGTGYRYIADAIAAANGNLAGITVWDATVDIPVGYAISGSTVEKKASNFTWVGEGEDASWSDLDNWRIGGNKPARLPDSVDAVSFAGTTVVMPGNVTVGAINCDRSVTLTKAGEDVVTLTAGSIVLTQLGASIAMSGVALSSEPVTTVRTSVADATVSVVTEDSVTTYTAVNAREAMVGDTKYSTIAEALEAAEEGDVVVLLKDVTIDLTKTGTTFNKAVVIDGNNLQYKVTFVRKHTWAQVNTANDAKLVLRNLTIEAENIEDYHYNYTAHLENPEHNIAFNCEVELDHVISNTALSFFKDATLDTVTINEKANVYAIWIHTTASTVDMKNLVINAPAGRGIKVDDTFVKSWDNTAAPSATSLAIDGATFTTLKKSAVLVNTKEAMSVAASGTIDISGVSTDPTNLVWVDESSAAYFGGVTVTGATLGAEPITGGYAATLSTDTKVDGYYKTLAGNTGAITAAGVDQTITLLQNVSEATSVSKAVTIDLNGNTLSGSIVLTDKDASVTVSGGTFKACVSTTVSGGATVISTTLADETTYRVVYGTIFSVY